MTDDELKKYFWNKFNSCYPVKHLDYPDSIFLYYDEQYIRKIKLEKINNKQQTTKSTITGYCLFEIDSNQNYINCDYDKFWCFFEDKYSMEYMKIKSFLEEIIKKNDNECNLKTLISWRPKGMFNNHDLKILNMNIFCEILKKHRLLECNKLSLL